jgi:hypothetical protein
MVSGIKPASDEGACGVFRTQDPRSNHCPERLNLGEQGRVDRTGVLGGNEFQTGRQGLVRESGEGCGSDGWRSAQAGLAANQAGELLLEKVCQCGDCQGQDFGRIVAAIDQRKAASDEIVGQGQRSFFIGNLNDSANADIVQAAPILESTG